MVWAAFTLAFFAFLRCSEFTYLGVRKFRPHFDLSTDCITFQPNLACPQYMTVQLKSSKTDVFRHGQSLTVARSSSTICAVMAIRAYFLLARPQSGPLFYFQSGRYLTRGVVSHLLQDSARFAGLPYQCLKGHSFRIGVASVAAAAGLPDWLIKVLGRWSSDCYQLYIRTPQSRSCTQLLPRWRPFRVVLLLIELNSFFLCLGGCIALHASVAVKSAQRLPPSLFASLLLFIAC